MSSKRTYINRKGKSKDKQYKSDWMRFHRDRKRLLIIKKVLGVLEKAFKFCFKKINAILKNIK